MKLLQLSLRELFLLVVIAAMGCGWWVRERQLRRELQKETGRSEHLASEINLLQRESHFLRVQSYGGGFGT